MASQWIPPALRTRAELRGMRVPDIKQKSIICALVAGAELPLKEDLAYVII